MKGLKEMHFNMCSVVGGVGVVVVVGVVATAAVILNNNIHKR